MEKNTDVMKEFDSGVQSIDKCGNTTLEGAKMPENSPIGEGKLPNSTIEKTKTTK